MQARKSQNCETETEEVVWMSDETFLCPDEQNQRFGIKTRRFKKQQQVGGLQPSVYV